jgi:hypothetical protein
MRAPGDEEDRGSAGAPCMDVQVEFTAKITSVTCKQNSRRVCVSVCYALIEELRMFLEGSGRRERSRGEQVQLLGAGRRLGRGGGPGGSRTRPVIIRMRAPDTGLQSPVREVSFSDISERSFCNCANILVEAFQ